jgi:hypothetical protein
MTMARRLATVENIEQQDCAERAFNKLTRTFAEALKNYRPKGEQKMTVQHVHVAEGGQAIVGNVSAPAPGVGRNEKAKEQPQAPAYAPGIAMPRQVEAERATVPRLPDAWSRWWAPKGNRNAFKHGAHSADALVLKRQIAALARMARDMMAGIV